MKELTPSTATIVESALKKISNPDEYLKVNFGSTPDSVRVIIQEIPGVQELVDLGPQVSNPVLNFLEHSVAEDQYELSAIALYILQRIAAPEAVQPLARALNNQQFNGLNLRLAADALLTSANIEVDEEEPISVALREATNLQ